MRSEVEVIKTSAPSSFRALAAAKPIPEASPAPVTSALLPLSENIKDTVSTTPLESP